MLIETWLDTEKQIGDEEQIKTVRSKLPKRVKKQRRIKIEGVVSGEDEGEWEEYYDYIFPDDDNQIRNIKILQKA